MSKQSAAETARPQVSFVFGMPGKGPKPIKLSVKIINSKPRTVPQVAVPVLLKKGNSPAERTIIIENVDQTKDIQFSFPTVQDRIGFEKPSELEKSGQPKKFLIKAGEQMNFVARTDVGSIPSHSDTDNRVYAFHIETWPELWNPSTDHEVGHVEC